MSYFVSEALDQYEIVFDIIKAIVKIIIDDILYSVEDKIYNNDNDIKHDEDQIAFGNHAKHGVAMSNNYIILMKTKK